MKYCNIVKPENSEKKIKKKQKIIEKNKKKLYNFKFTKVRYTNQNL